MDVGGLKHTTTMATLRTEKGSMLEAMYPIKKQSDGTVFIDRDGRHFHYVLNYLSGNVAAAEKKNNKRSWVLSVAGFEEYSFICYRKNWRFMLERISGARRHNWFYKFTWDKKINPLWKQKIG